VFLGSFRTLLVAQTQQLALAFAHLHARDGLDGEVVARQREDLFFHMQGYLVGEAVRRIRAEGRVEGLEGRHLESAKGEGRMDWEEREFVLRRCVRLSEDELQKCSAVN
jgi:hypothetical protein